MATEVANRLARRIRQSGPVGVADFMAMAVGHYYAGRDPFGSLGDFITAPEISQMFGELLGLWAAQSWLEMGQPIPLVLAELGPGRGTLLADALRAARVVPAFLSALRLHLVETSPSLRARQRQSLGGIPGVAPAQFHDRLETLPPGPTILLANEFFDALPIRQFERRDDGWHERMIDLTPAGDGFRFVLTPDPRAIEALLPPSVRAAPPGSVAEICPLGRAIAASIAARLVEHGGVALIIDYGPPVSAPGDSLQALRGHRFHPVLQDPGSADLTAHVDFAALAAAATAEGAAVYGPCGQGAFLRRLGIEQRAARLARNATSAGAEATYAALQRLTDAAAMGTLFQVLAMSAPSSAPPAGMEP